MGAADAAAAIPEVESLHTAIVTRDKQAALAFIDRFPASPLVDDLIAMLPREVAQAVCADLPSGATRAQQACRKWDLRRGARGGPGAGDDGDAGRGDGATSPDAPGQALAGARSRSAGTTGERAAVARLPPPRLEDSATTPADDERAIERARTARREAEAAPQPERNRAPLIARRGRDPGSASPPSSRGKDSGSDPGSESGGDTGRDSHN